MTFVTEKGATQLKVTVKLKDSEKEITEFQNITKKDGAPNDIGVATFKHIVEAFGPAAETLTSSKQEVVGYKEKVNADVVAGMEKTDIIVLVRAVHEEGAKFEDYNIIEGFLKIDGTNSKGEDLVTPYLEKVEKTPVLQRKAKGGSGSSKAKGAVDEKAKKELDELV
jgi:hypothetical protein